MLFKYLKIMLIILSVAWLQSHLYADELSGSGVPNVFKPRDITAYQLPNGLKVLLYPESSKPEVTVNVVYKTGARHENPGEYGMAHLLEHLLFNSAGKYSNIPREMASRGARFNANTNADRTTYYETLPASSANLEFAIALEAERMAGGRPGNEAIEKELSAVKNEWEQSDGSAFQPLLKAMLEIAYPQHAYGRDTLGVREGVLQSRPEQLRAFYQRRYGPNLAVLSIGGSFDLDEAKRLILQYFGAIPALKINEDSTVFEAIPQPHKRQVQLHRPDGQAYVGLIYRAMRGADPRFVAAQALVHCLGSGSQSLLQKKLVRSGRARQVFGFVQQSAGEGFIAFMAQPVKGQDPGQLAERMAALLEQSSASCNRSDLARFQTENSQGWQEMLRDTRAMTMQLGEFEVFGAWQLMDMEQDTGRRLQVQDVKDAARWLNHRNRIVGVLDDRHRVSYKLRN